MDSVRWGSGWRRSRKCGDEVGDFASREGGVGGVVLPMERYWLLRSVCRLELCGPQDDDALCLGELKVERGLDGLS